MAAYSRPSPVPAEPLALSTGDFEEVPWNAGPAHAAPPYRVAPPAPGSLAPMAMGADGTGPQARHAETVLLRQGPSPKTGFLILAAGAVIGSVLGIALRSHPAPAAARALPYDPGTSQPAPIVAPPTNHPPHAMNGGVVENSGYVPPQTPPGLPEAKEDAPKEPAAQKELPKESKKGRTRWRVASPKAERAPKAERVEKPAKPAKAEKDDDDGYRVASADPTETKKVAAKEPKAAPAKEPVEAAPPTKKSTPPAKAGKPGSEDAMSVLKAAMGATENTL